MSVVADGGAGDDFNEDHNMNLLGHEYDNALAEVAARWGADDGAIVRNHEAHWTAALRGVSLTITLRQIDGRGLSPDLRIGSSGCLPLSPLAALAVLDDARATILRAVSAHTQLGSVVVWFDEAPCDKCSGRGTIRAAACAGCDGTGKRKT